jgi:uncharacterized protein (DUF58 family)
MLTPHDQQRLSALQWLATGVVEGLTSGSHRSPRIGRSVAFKEHRAYMRGDDIGSIDWKLFGKTDRLFVRQYEDETNLRAMILLDQSGSMAYRGSQSPLSKHQFAVHLAACLATLFIRQQDAVGIGIVDAQLQQVIPPRGTQLHLRAILQALVQSECTAETSLATALLQAAVHLRRRGVLILISDCFDDVERLRNALRAYRQTHSAVVVFQIWDRDELEFPFRGRTQFRSLEDSAARPAVDARALRESYLQRLEEFQQQLSQTLAAERIELVSCTTDQAVGDILSAFLAGRTDKPRAVQATAAPRRPLS